MGFWSKKKSIEPSPKASLPAEKAITPNSVKSQRDTVPLTRAGLPNLAHIKYIIAIASAKGGVGKSTLTVNLALALKHHGAKVGLLDADIYGPSQAGMLGVTNERLHSDGAELAPITKYGVDIISMGLLGNDGPVVWRAPMANKMIKQFLGNVHWGALDYLLIDLPPGTGDVQLTIAQQASLAGAVIVTTPQDVVTGIAKKGIKMFETLNVPILGVIENMSTFVCGHCGEETAIFKGTGGQQLAKEQGVPFFGSIPLDPALAASGDKGVPILAEKTEKTATVVGKAFLNLAQVLMTQMEHGASEATRVLEPEKTELSPSGDLVIQWPDAHTSIYRPHTLRVHCACAACVDENTGRKTLDPRTIIPDIRITAIGNVGRYALSPRFSDGHTTGIYPFKKLRELCACESCLGLRKES
jgi:ATP-binding protein involved in chromosome partitioning